MLGSFLMLYMKQFQMSKLAFIYFKKRVYNTENESILRVRKQIKHTHRKGVKMLGEITMLNKYELVNNEGCLMDTISALSFKSARSYFVGKFSGKYKIICSEKLETKNVRL